MSNQDPEILWELQGVSKYFVMGSGLARALHNVSFSIRAGEVVALAGPSGSGKTTLLHLLGGIERPSVGKVAFAGRSMADRSRRELARMRAGDLSFIFQNFNLLPVLTAAENVDLPLHNKEMLARERRDRVAWALHEVGIPELAGRRPGELSGGQRQRVAIARALAGHPRAVLADEPTASLDFGTGREIIQLMLRLHQAYGLTIVFSTHDPRVLEAAPRILEFKDGCLSWERKPQSPDDGNVKGRMEGIPAP